MVRAKFQVTGITERQGGGGEVELTTIYDSSIPEDQRFQQATPWGQVKMNIDNPAAKQFFTLGKYVYADFTPAE